MPVSPRRRRSYLAALALASIACLAASAACARVVPNSPRVPGQVARTQPARDLATPPPGCDDAGKARQPVRGLVLSNSPQCRQQARDYLLRAIMAMNRSRR